VTRMPGASRGGHARHRQERASLPSLERFGPCAASSTQVEHSVREPERAARGSQATSAATRRRGQRNWHRLVPAGSEAKASLACEGRAARLGVPARRLSVAEVGERRLGSEKYDPLAIGSCGRGPEPLSRSHRKVALVWWIQKRRRPAPRWPSRGAGRGPSRAFERTSRGRGFRSMEGTPDRFRGQLVHARRQRGDLGGSRDVFVNVRTVTASRERRQGCQRLGTHASRREDNAHRDGKPLSGRARATRRSENCADVHQAITSMSVCR
jgi:hypothetical protein